MEVAITLPIRTWATLDVALGFFRAAPGKLAEGRITRHCQRLHILLRRGGIRSRYALVGTADSGKSLLRLHVQGPPQREPWILNLPLRAAESLAEACLTIMGVQTDPQLGALLEYEAEELQAARSFLSEVRRQCPTLGRVVRRVRGPKSVRWDERGQEYVFVPPVAQRVHWHYLRVGAGVN
jgi:hypothetical protein